MEGVEEPSGNEILPIEKMLDTPLEPYVRNYTKTVSICNFTFPKTLW